MNYKYFIIEILIRKNRVQCMSIDARNLLLQCEQKCPPVRVHYSKQHSILEYLYLMCTSYVICVYQRNSVYMLSCSMWSRSAKSSCPSPWSDIANKHLEYIECKEVVNSSSTIDVQLHVLRAICQHNAQTRHVRANILYLCYRY